MNNKNELQRLRGIIDKIDNQILDLLSQRFNVAKKIGNLKINNNIQIGDFTREGDLIIKRIKKASELNLCPSFVAGLWSFIIFYSRVLQEGMLKEGEDEKKRMERKR